MEKIRRIISMFAIAFAGAVLAVFLYAKFIVRDQSIMVRETTPIRLTNQVSSQNPQSQLPDLTVAADKSVHAVVHIEVKVHEQMGDINDNPCLLYASDAADEEDSVDLGGRRIIKK